MRRQDLHEEQRRLRELPPCLQEALEPHYHRSEAQHYLLAARGGLVVRFKGVELKGDWVRLSKVTNLSGSKVKVLSDPIVFEGGLDLELDEIVWCAPVKGDKGSE